MFDSLISGEATIRLSIFLAVFSVFVIWEIIAPRRSLHYSKKIRWLNNLTISVINVLLTRLLIPVTVIYIAAFAETSNVGLLNQFNLPVLIAVIIAFLLLDLAIYLQHVIFHKVDFLWRLHRMHHADLDFDITTGIRFHPIEMILSHGIKMLVVLALGPPVIAVLIFEVMLNASSMFNHANIRIPKKLERILRLIIVTPEMHRVHHSVKPIETDSNFGFNLPWWDHLFNTYRAQPQDGHTNMSIGIEQFRDTKELWLPKLLVQPFRNSN
ncbi:MAG: sterol desaturase family protein [Pseudomonadota bacterium]